MKTSIFEANKKYTFSDYFEMNYLTEDIVGEFGYSFSIEKLQLPKFFDYDTAIIQNLNNTYYNIFPKIGLHSETAKREFLIAPLLLEVAKHSSVKINVEYPINIDEKLSGFFDYFLQQKHQLLVIEAKRKDIDNGFNQLAAELIALDKYTEDETELLYGAVTLGDIWRFARLNRTEKHIAKNIQMHTIPDDTEDVFAILMGILN